MIEFRNWMQSRNIRFIFCRTSRGKNRGKKCAPGVIDTWFTIELSGLRPPRGYRWKKLSQFRTSKRPCSRKLCASSTPNARVVGPERATDSIKTCADGVRFSKRRRIKLGFIAHQKYNLLSKLRNNKMKM